MSDGRRFLLDTNVISETRLRRADARVLEFLAWAGAPALLLSVLTLGEMRQGAAKLRKKDAEGALALSRWVDETEQTYADRILSVDSRVARLWGEMSAGRSRPVVDTLLAATALVHGLTLVTRNTRDVADTGVALLNPWV